MNSTAEEIIEFTDENNVKFVRLSFCDMFGISKNMAIMASELPSALDNGVTFDGGAIADFRSTAQSDLLLFPDPSTPVILPWRPGPGRVVRLFCDIKNPDGTDFALDSRSLLRRVIARAGKMGYVCKIGAECEFTLFKTDENGEATLTPYDNGGYLDVAPLDRGEDIRREICLTLEEMGITPKNSHHERGPGQNEINFEVVDALCCADNFLTFKTVVKAIAARSGLYASFMPKPIAGSAGNGLHINLSLSSNEENIFKSADEGHNPVAESFIAGILSKSAEIAVFLNPLTNSYARLGEFEAPGYVSWSHQNRSALIRIPAAKGDKVRMELRSPDPAINPYLAFALVISAGLDGIEKNIKLPEAVDSDLYEAGSDVTGTLERLPVSLDEAITLAERSSFVRDILGEDFTGKYLANKKAEAAEYAVNDDKEAYSMKRYFPII